MLMCESCHSDYADVDGLCVLCHAESSVDFSLDVVESARPRYEGTGARIDKKLNRQMRCEEEARRKTTRQKKKNHRMKRKHKRS